MVQGWMMVTAIVIIGANLIADLVYAYLDPRIRLG
jgi:peptide/nickel transport system permease protein